MSHIMTTRNYSLLAALLLAVMTQAVTAQTRPINYQGYLAQPDGTPIDTTVSMDVELWTAATGGTLLYSESHAAVTVSKGRFSIEISTGTPVSGTFNADQFVQDTWLALTINGELLNPRSQLGAVAGSQHAEIAERLSTSCADGEWVGYRGGQLACYECPVGSSTGCYDGPPATQGVGVCSGGNSACVDGAFSSTCNNQVLPGTESCNSLDDDCNGQVDDGTSLPGCVTLSIDNDGDGFGDTLLQGCLCPGAPGTVTVAGDCDDADINVNPGQTSFFTVQNNQGTFDYNCDSIIEKNFSQPGVASCTFNGTSCDYVFGFIVGPADCGEVRVVSGACNINGTICTLVQSSSAFVQGCR